MRKAMDRKPSHVLIGGDFNFKEIDWEKEFVQGNHPEVDGEDEFVQGNHPEVDGEDEFVQGNHPEVDGARRVCPR